MPYTIIYNSFYFENLASSLPGALAKGQDGTLSINLLTPAHVHIPSYSVDETGGWVLEIFKRPSEYLGKFILFSTGEMHSDLDRAGKDGVELIGEKLTVIRYAELISKAIGAPVIAHVLSTEEFENQANTENPQLKQFYLTMKYVARSFPVYFGTDRHCPH